MTAYIIARVNITDREQYRRYLAIVPSVIEQYGGRVMARSEEPVTLEGPEEKRRIIILRFPSVSRAREFYHSPEYGNARALREGAAAGELVVVEGCLPG